MKVRRRIIFLMPAILLAAAMAILPVAAGQRADKANAAARIAKAHALRDLSATAFTTDRLSSTFPARRAAELAPKDTTVMLWANMVRMFGVQPDTVLFDSQAALLANYPQASTDYYMQLVNMASKPALKRLKQGYDLALEASRTSPADERLAWLSLSYGTALLGYDAGLSEDDTTMLVADEYRPRAMQLVEMADSLMAVHGPDIQAQQSRVKLLLMLGDTLRITQTADSMLAHGANDPEVLNAVIRMYYAVGRHDDVTELGIRSFELEPDAQELYNLFGAVQTQADTLRLQEAVIHVAANSSLEPETRTEALDAAIYATYQYINEYTEDDVRTRFTQRVDSTAREMIADEPDNYELAVNLAKLGRIANWVNDFGGHYLTDYAQRYPEADTLNARSIALLNSANYDGEDFGPMIDRLIDHKPKEPPYYHLKALWLGRTDRSVEGAEVLNAVTYSMILDYTRETYPDKTEAEIAEEAKRVWASTLNVKADMYYAGGDTQKAIDGYHRALSVDPENAGVLNNLAYISATEGGDVNEALDLVNRSLELVPDNLNTIDSRAWIYYLLGRYDDALADMVKYFDLAQIDIRLFSTPDEFFNTFGSVLRGTFGDDYTPDSLTDEDYAGVAEAIFHRNEEQNAQPILTHLLAIYDAMGLDKEAASVARFVAAYADDEPTVKAYLAKHPDYKTLLK